MRPAPRAIRCLPPLPVLSSKLPRVSVHVGPLLHGVSRAGTHAGGEPAPRLAAELKRVLVMPTGLIVQACGEPDRLGCGEPDRPACGEIENRREITISPQFGGSRELVVDGVAD